MTRISAMYFLSTGDGGLNFRFFDLEPVGVAAAAERDLARSAGVAHPVGGTIA